MRKYFSNCPEGAQFLKFRAYMGGLTMVELMIVIVVVAVTTTLAMPSLSMSLRNNEMQAQTLMLLSILNFAKNEAVRRNTNVNLQISAASDAWTVIVKDPTEEADVEGCVPGQLRCTTNTDSVLTSDLAELTFNNRGYIKGIDDAWASETIFLQHTHCAGVHQRFRIDITPTGQVSSCNLACDSLEACP